MTGLASLEEFRGDPQTARLPLRWQLSRKLCGGSGGRGESGAGRGSGAGCCRAGLLATPAAGAPAPAAGGRGTPSAGPDASDCSTAGARLLRGRGLSRRAPGVWRRGVRWAQEPRARVEPAVPVFRVPGPGPQPPRGPQPPAPRALPRSGDPGRAGSCARS